MGHRRRLSVLRNARSRLLRHLSSSAVIFLADVVVGRAASSINLAKASGGSARFDLPATDRVTLDRWVGARSTPQGLLVRSRIILLLGQGLSGRAVAGRLRVSRHTVDLWRARYRDGGCVALTREKPGRGRKSSVGIEGSEKAETPGPVISTSPAAAEQVQLLQPSARRIEAHRSP